MVARIAAIGAWSLVWLAVPGAQTRWIDIERSTVTVHFSASEKPGMDATGYVIEAPLAEGSVDDTDAPHLALVIDVQQLRIREPRCSSEEGRKMYASMVGPEGLDSERFSRITYHSLTVDPLEADGWLVQGELQIQDRFVPLDIHAARHGDRFTGTTTLLLNDFGISLTNAAEVTTTMDYELRVDFDIVLETP